MISTPAPILRNLLPAVLSAFMGVGCAGVVLSAVPRVTAAEPRAATGSAPAHSLVVWLAALAEVETGNDPAAVGRAGERTPYQISPRVWAAYSRQPMRSATASEGRRVASRILSDRVERVQEITEQDAIAEGFPDPDGQNRKFPDRARYWFRNLWDSINSKRGFGWDANPWVWVITFRRVFP